MKKLTTCVSVYMQLLQSIACGYIVTVHNSVTYSVIKPCCIRDMFYVIHRQGLDSYSFADSDHNLVCIILLNIYDKMSILLLLYDS